MPDATTAIPSRFGCCAAWSAGRHQLKLLDACSLAGRSIGAHHKKHAASERQVYDNVTFAACKAMPMVTGFGDAAR